MFHLFFCFIKKNQIKNKRFDIGFFIYFFTIKHIPKELENAKVIHRMEFNKGCDTTKVSSLKALYF